MKTLKRISILVMIASILTTFSCTKEGKQGETGPQGSAGTNGNANVASLTFDVNSWNWSSNNCNLSATNVTTSIVSSGSVLVYMETSPYSEQWAAIPLSSSGIEIIYSYQVGNVNIVASPQPTSHERFKVVAIASSARLANPNIDYSNYYEVKGAFNLKD